MAADPFAFYRGSAPLFYADVSGLDDPFVDERTSRVWIQGDLHPENYGTYMSADGLLVFDVNDFDEAYLGHYTWDLLRMAAGVSLLGFTMALSDDTVRQVNRAYATAYAEQVRAFAERRQGRGVRAQAGEHRRHGPDRAARRPRADAHPAAGGPDQGRRGERRFAERAGVRRAGRGRAGRRLRRLPATTWTPSPPTSASRACPTRSRTSSAAAASASAAPACPRTRC